MEKREGHWGPWCVGRTRVGPGRAIRRGGTRDPTLPESRPGRRRRHSGRPQVLTPHSYRSSRKDARVTSGGRWTGGGVGQWRGSDPPPESGGVLPLPSKVTHVTFSLTVLHSPERLGLPYTYHPVHRPHLFSVQGGRNRVGEGRVARDRALRHPLCYRRVPGLVTTDLGTHRSTGGGGRPGSVG